MYFIYVDESGTKDPGLVKIRPDGSVLEKDWLYVIGIAVYEMDWFRFEYALNQRKLNFVKRIYADERVRLELVDTEMHSACIRNPKERQRHPFLSRLTDIELNNLVDFYLEQPAYHSFRMFAVVVDKRYLHDYYDEQKLHRKAYELLIERIEWFMRNNHPKHRALMVLDDTSRQMNRSLAMKHSLFQRQGTSNGSRISHIVELPMFVDSSLSNGVQFAILCAYNVYRAFRDENLKYEYFKKISGCFYQERERQESHIEGLKVFPDKTPLKYLVEQLPEHNDARRG